MKERPILYSPDMVSATLDRRKTQTRRPRGLELVNKDPDDWGFIGIEIRKGIPKARFHRKQGTGLPLDPEIAFLKCPYGQPGDLLYVKETWKPWGWDCQGSWSILFRADDGVVDIENGLFEDPDREEEFGFQLCDLLDEKGCPKNDERDYQKPADHLPWRSGRFMPKRAARIWLRITDIRAERVQDISEEDIKAEGVQVPVSEKGNILWHLGQKNSAFSFLPDGCLAKGAPKLTTEVVLKALWAELWCKINGRESYDLNPWVWAIGLEVLSTTGRPESLIKSMKAESIN